MKLPPIIRSLLDQDLYKITMQQTFLHQQPGRWGRYAFKCRNKVTWTPEMAKEIMEQIQHLCTLKYTQDELDYLSTIRFIKKDFIEFLRLFQLNINHLKVFAFSDPEEDWGPEIEFEGPIYLVSPFETFILSIVNEVYFAFTSWLPPVGNGADLILLQERADDRLQEKIELVKTHPFRFTEFGTRRRFSRSWQEHVVTTLKREIPSTGIFSGTSNVYLAMKYDLTPIGTMAHEFIQLYQGVKDVRLANSQKAAFQAWVDEYRGDLGIALTDTLGTNKFMKDWDLYFAKLFDGLRHDSGDPFKWTDKMMAHYQRLGVDISTKQLVYSNALTFPYAWDLQRTYGDKALISFGIGTNLTNDFPGLTPLNIVIKLVEVDGYPVAKISDDAGKTMCEDIRFLEYLNKVCEK